MTKPDITRNVISDLWPLYKSGEASADTKRIVEEFLSQDRDFRTVLEESEQIQKGLPDMTLSPDTELQLISLARQRIRTIAWLVGSAIAAFVFVSLFFALGAIWFATTHGH
jgi:ferric-dicitrate binding protein FerR (iron transport regulator)